jgi:hypothetical protein
MYLGESGWVKRGWSWEIVATLAISGHGDAGHLVLKVMERMVSYKSGPRTGLIPSPPPPLGLVKPNERDIWSRFST